LHHPGVGDNPSSVLETARCAKA